jgi:hypothetical protein
MRAFANRVLYRYLEEFFPRGLLFYAHFGMPTGWKIAGSV